VGGNSSLGVNILRVPVAARERRGLGTRSLNLPKICRGQVAGSEEVSNSYVRRSSINILKNGKTARPSVNGRHTTVEELGNGANERSHACLRGTYNRRSCQRKKLPVIRKLSTEAQKTMNLLDPLYANMGAWVE